MAPRTYLDDPQTPLRLHEISEAIKEATYMDDRGRVHALGLERSKITTRIREEVAALHGAADPDLLIALWSTAQLSHEGGLRYARTGCRDETDVPDPS